MARGGRRAGKPGVAYPNRADLNTTKQLPVQAATGQAYGVAGQQTAAQRAVPMGPPPSQPPPQQAAAPSVNPIAQPGTLGAFDRPSERPHEPITAGAATGPGPGMEALNLPPQDLSGLLNQLARTSPAVAQLASYVNSGRA